MSERESNVDRVETEERNQAEGAPPDAFTERTYKAGGVLLMIAGIIGAIIGLALLLGGASVGTVFGVNGLVLVAVGAVMLIFSLIEFAGGAASYNGRSWYGGIIGGILGILTIFTIPLDLIGLVLISLGEGQFRK